MNRRAHYQFDPDRRGQVIDGLRPSDELRQVPTRRYPGLDHAQPGIGAYGPEVVQGPGGQIIQDRNGLAVGQEPFHEMRPDEPGAAGHENVLRAACCVLGAQGRPLVGMPSGLCVRSSDLWLSLLRSRLPASAFGLWALALSASAPATASASFCRYAGSAIRRASRGLDR